MKEKILEFLKQQEGFISGQRICDELGVSRTAVWKYMNSLKKEGYEIESVTRKGYRLLQSPDLLTREAVLSCIKKGEYQVSYAALKALILRMRRQNVVEKLVRQMEVSMWQTIRLTVKAEEEEHGCLHLGRIFFSRYY